MNRSDDLVLLQARLKSPLKEFSDRNVTNTAWTLYLNHGIAGHRNAGHLGRGICVCNASPNSASIPHLVVSYMRDCFRQQWVRRREPCVLFYINPTYTSSQPNPRLTY